MKPLDYYKEQLIAAGADVSRPQYDISTLSGLEANNPGLFEFATRVLLAGIEFERRQKEAQL